MSKQTDRKLCPKCGFGILRYIMNFNGQRIYECLKCNWRGPQ